MRALEPHFRGSGIGPGRALGGGMSDAESTRDLDEKPMKSALKPLLILLVPFAAMLVYGVLSS